jgi:hypothetical protein
MSLARDSLDRLEYNKEQNGAFDEEAAGIWSADQSVPDRIPPD